MSYLKRCTFIFHTSAKYVKLIEVIYNRQDIIALQMITTDAAFGIFKTHIWSFYPFTENFRTVWTLKRFMRAIKRGYLMLFVLTLVSVIFIGTSCGYEGDKKTSFYFRQFRLFRKTFCIISLSKWVSQTCVFLDDKLFIQKVLFIYYVVVPLITWSMGLMFWFN